MSDTHAGYLVTLETDLSEEESERIIAALSMIKGVVSTTPIVSSFEIQIGYERAKREIGTKLLGAYKEILWRCDVG